MNKRYIVIAVIASLLALGACEKKSTMEKAEDKVNDALDRRPAEGVRDAAEDAGAAMKHAGNSVKDAAKEAAEDVKDATSK